VTADEGHAEYEIDDKKERTPEYRFGDFFELSVWQKFLEIGGTPSFLHASADPMENSSLTRFAWLSIAVSVLTIILKTVAYKLTGSVGLLSDAVESLVNVAGGVMALMMLKVAARPADDEHAYGHSKAEYFSSGVEGTLILIAAASIGYAAYGRLRDPQPLSDVRDGLIVTVVALLLNLGTGMLLLRVGKKRNSITLEANAHHLMTDVWTSVGVVAAVGLVAWTGWTLLDPLVAILVAANIVWTGIKIVRRSVAGLMDVSLPAADIEIVKGIFDRHRVHGIQFHALRTRQAGSRKFVAVDVLVPGVWTVQKGHDLLEQIEEEIRSSIEASTVFTHLEPIEDPLSWADEKLDRPAHSPKPR
jgi:cation diffusion facilitator family transporter